MGKPGRSVRCKGGEITLLISLVLKPRRGGWTDLSFVRRMNPIPDFIRNRFQQVVVD